MKITVLLTQWKRNNLYLQLKHINNQTLKPNNIIVFQNEEHVNIDNLKKEFDFIHVKSSFNTKYFGRFSYLFNIDSDFCIVMDDDIIPGKNCIKNYIEQCIRTNSIIGGNGRIGMLSPLYCDKGQYYEGCNRFTSKITHPPDVGIRKQTKVDFVGHLWCFRKEWLYYMFSVKPYTMDTGEDMHLCFSCKMLGNIDSYVAEHKSIDDMSDVAFNKLASDQHASWKITKPSLRRAVEQYWVDKGLKYITEN